MTFYFVFFCLYVLFVEMRSHAGSGKSSAGAKYDQSLQIKRLPNPNQMSKINTEIRIRVCSFAEENEIDLIIIKQLELQLAA